MGQSGPPNTNPGYGTAGVPTCTQLFDKDCQL